MYMTCIGKIQKIGRLRYQSKYKISNICKFSFISFFNSQTWLRDLPNLELHATCMVLRGITTTSKSTWFQMFQEKTLNISSVFLEHSAIYYLEKNYFSKKPKSSNVTNLCLLDPNYIHIAQHQEPKIEIWFSVSMLIASYYTTLFYWTWYVLRREHRHGYLLAVAHVLCQLVLCIDFI